MTKPFLILACSSAFSSCGQPVIETKPTVTEYTGCYDFGFESGFFAQAPVHSDSELWYVVSAPDQFWDAIKRLEKPNQGAQVHVSVRATLGPEGRNGYGHMGLAKREMHIMEILELRANTKSDGSCFPPPPPPFPQPASANKSSLNTGAPKDGAPVS